jgi:hypothetical protein
VVGELDLEAAELDPGVERRPVLLVEPGLTDGVRRFGFCTC